MEKIRVKDMVDSVSITHSFNRDELIFLNTSDVFNGEIINKNNMKVIDLKGQAKKTIENDDILFSEIRPKNKRFAYVSVENPRDYVVSTKLMVLRNKNSKVLQKYFYYFITSESMLDYLQMRAESRIGSFPQITFSLFADYEILLPSLKEQTEIVRKLDILSDKLDTNNKLINDLEDYSQLLFHKWFVDFNFPNEEGKPYKDSGGEMVKVDGKMLPKDWKISTVGQECTTIMGQSPPSDTYNTAMDGLPFYQGVVDYGFKYPTVSTWCNLPTRVALPGDILLSVRAPVGRLNVATHKCCVGRGVSAIRLENTRNYFALYELDKNMLRLKKQGTGTVFDSIRKNDILNLGFMKPNNCILHKFEDTIRPLQEKIYYANNENTLLSETRDLLIKKLIR